MLEVSTYDVAVKKGQQPRQHERRAWYVPFLWFDPCAHFQTKVQGHVHRCDQGGKLYLGLLRHREGEWKVDFCGAGSFTTYFYESTSARLHFCPYMHYRCNANICYTLYYSARIMLFDCESR